MEKTLFVHQKAAINTLNNTFIDSNIYTSGLLVIPTGGGKTFTCSYWLKEKYQKYNCKIIWLAQSIELLNQAEKCLKEFFPDKSIKVISSSPHHSNKTDINTLDDILIISCMTASRSIKKSDSLLNDYLSLHANELFIVIVDEAHHSPAYGTRSLLQYLKQKNKKMWLLGMTATPTYTVQEKRGWLWKLYEEGIIYEVSKTFLQDQKILAKEKYIKKKTPTKVSISDSDFNKLCKKASDIPEKIIEELATNKERNDYIINDYLRHKDIYGKTIIFLDRWYQCLYFKDKLLENGIHVDAVYHQQGQNTNQIIIDNFRQNQKGVLLNVRMLTEGVDIPDVETVFITRQTTSYILLQQMIGRALRGIKANGKKEYANIILFGDTWNRSIAWAKPSSQGGTDTEKNITHSFPVKSISDIILNRYIKTLNFKKCNDSNFLDLIPIGWYKLHYTTYCETDGICNNLDYILIYNNELHLWSHYVDIIMNKLVSIDNNEVIGHSEIINEIYIETYPEIKNTFDNSKTKIIGLITTILQTNKEPEYFNFIHRDQLDISNLVDTLSKLPEIHRNQVIEDIYNEPGNIWRVIFGSFDLFMHIINLYLNNDINNEKIMNLNFDIDYATNNSNQKELFKTVRERDGKKCVCCGLPSSTVPLSVVPIYVVGDEGLSINNLQSMCARCKKYFKAKPMVNYLSMNQLLNSNFDFTGLNLESRFFKNIERLQACIRASINISFGANICTLTLLSRRKNSTNVLYNVCKIEVNRTENIALLNKYSDKILYYIQNKLNQVHITSLEITVHPKK